MTDSGFFSSLDKLMFDDGLALLFDEEASKVNGFLPLTLLQNFAVMFDQRSLSLVKVRADI